MKETGIRGSPETEKLVLDTGVLVEYIVEKAPYRSVVEKLFKMEFAGKVNLYISFVTLSETLYVASRIYEAAAIPHPNEEALNYALWVKGKVKVANLDDDVAVRSGELKKDLCLALPDCYVLATAELLNATPLFRKPEKEMKPVLDKLRKLKVKFLEEIGLELRGLK